MKKNKLGITEGEAKVNDSFITEVWASDTKIASCNNGINSSIYKVKSDSEMKSNAALIADAFNTANKCGLLPSKLLEQRDTLLQSLKNARDHIEWFNSSKNYDFIINDAYATINQIEQ